MRCQRLNLIVLIFLGAFPAPAVFGQCKPSVTLSTKGTTNGCNSVTVNYSVANGALAGKDWLVSLTINGTVIDVSKCTINQSCAGEKGNAVAPLKLAAGVYEVKIEVLLKDGTKVNTFASVTFGTGSCPDEADLGACDRDQGEILRKHSAMYPALTWSAPVG